MAAKRAMTPAAKHAKRNKFSFHSDDDDDDIVIGSMEMDSDDTNIFTSDESENDWVSEPSTHGNEQLNHKPLVLKVPRGTATVPESVKNPGSALISDKQQKEILPEHLNALNIMPVDHICIFADTSKAFKDIALKFFAMKHRNMQMELLACPVTGMI